MSRVLMLVNHECYRKQTSCYLFDHGLSKDVDEFQKTGDFFSVKLKYPLYNRQDGGLNVFLN